jgi:LytS/YehU family sensor histidine kinase
VNRYERVLAGTPVKEIEQVNGLYLSYSFNPIGNADKITGVNIFAEDITERIVQERELADAMKKIGELKLTALRSVMNPHFIFNALNSIQFFIAKNDRQNAINYLSTFSKLIRGILTSSVENKIALSDELELLKYYINLEILRFENKFHVVYNIDSDLDQESIEVPSLLIQPFVENAIIHGLYSKKGTQDGRLTISVRKEPDNRILFEIEDNGIGRHAAEKLKVQNFPSHKSMGAMLTAERLKMLSDDGRAHHETIDLVEDGKPAGTLVKIWIPM